MALGGLVPGLCPFPPIPLPTPIILNRDTTPKVVPQRASSQSGSVRVPASSHCRASSPMEGDEEVSQQGDSGGEGWYRGPVLRSLPAPSGLTP